MGHQHGVSAPRPKKYGGAKNGAILDLSNGLVMGLVLLAGVLLGAGLCAAYTIYANWQRARQLHEPLVPATWPLATRSLLTSEERDGLAWLKTTFHDHMVMVKVPVLRFTLPTHKSQDTAAQRWQTLLNGVYCTYTVCTPQGKVVGCVDLPGKHGLPQSARALKEKLLSDCGLAYTVVVLADLPKSTAMRAAFLGEAQEQEALPHQTTRGGDSNFQADLAAFNKRAQQEAKATALARLNKTNKVSKALGAGP